MEESPRKKDKKKRKKTENEVEADDPKHGGQAEIDSLSELLKAVIINSGDDSEDHNHRNKSGQQKRKTVLFSEVTLDDSHIICGYSNDQIKVIDTQKLEEWIPEAKSTLTCRHHGLSCLRCSRENPSVFFTSSVKEGNIFQWDQRASNYFKPVQKYVIKSEAGGLSMNNTKTILNFDVSHNDRVICGGTELVDQDCYLLFWDIRSTKLLGAYWESHSDDITTVNFNPTNDKKLASGSTDGLLNVFDIGQTSEDDALVFSFNSESSVDAVCWGSTDNSGTTQDSKEYQTIACLTHTNDIHIFDAESGDPVVKFDRPAISKARSSGPSWESSSTQADDDSVYLQGSYRTNCQSSLGILVSSLPGSARKCAQVWNVQGTDLKPCCTFSQQYSLIQSAAPFHQANNYWYTFDEEGISKLWKPEQEGSSNVKLAKRKKH